VGVVKWPFFVEWARGRVPAELGVTMLARAGAAAFLYGDVEISPSS
jgi:hypothetical protein